MNVAIIPVRSIDGLNMSVPVARIDVIEEMENGNAAITVNGQRIPTDFKFKDMEDTVTSFHFQYMNVPKV